MAVRRSFEMAVSREEFFRFLTAALGDFEADGETARGTIGGRPWVVSLVPLPDRRLGSVVVPRHRVEITIDTPTEAEGAAFLERFHRAFLRGGG
jgi:hypothetical protein